MREILFRGRTVKEQWAYGLLAHIGNAWYISNKAGVATAYEVIPSTVGQFTGLKDRNGKKVFEGDIVRVSRGKDIETGEIQYNKYGVWVIVYDKFYCNTFPYIFTSSDSNVWIKVIGNIHDNPELLNAEDSQ